MIARCVVLAAGASALMAPVAPARPATQLSAEVSSVERSPAMPFLPRPQKLKGMLAVVGFVATDLGFRLPGEMHNVASINAHDMAVDMGAMTQIGIWIAVAECIGYLAILEMLDGSGRQPGDFGFDPLQIGGANDPEM